MRRYLIIEQITMSISNDRNEFFTTLWRISAVEYILSIDEPSDISLRRFLWKRREGREKKSKEKGESNQSYLCPRDILGLGSCIVLKRAKYIWPSHDCRLPLYKHFRDREYHCSLDKIGGYDRAISTLTLTSPTSQRRAQHLYIHQPQ